MTNEQKGQESRATEGNQPVFLLPSVVSALLGLMIAIHLARVFVLNESGVGALVGWFGFIPLRALVPEAFEGGWIPLLWTGFSHAFLHAGWEHLLFNCAWLAIFGTPVARRYGARPTVILFLASAFAGAIFFAATTLPQLQILVGASGGIAGLTGAACRFMFQPVVVARDPQTGETRVLGRRTARLGELAANQRAAFFIGIWLVLNAAVPFLPVLFGQAIGIAWQAHLGGFIAGLLLVPLFDPRPTEANT